MIVDANNLIVGRMATFVAKKALLGEKIEIVNCENAVMTGSKKQVFARFKQKIELGTHKGPFLHRNPERIVRRIIRGMLPYKKEKGAKAFKRIMCHVGVPNEFKDKKMETLKDADVSKLPNLKFVSIGDVSKFLGGKI